MKPVTHSPMTNSPQAHKQRGVSLIIVLVFLLLAIISVLGAFRVGFLNETMVGNEADMSRTQAAAEAMIRDAEQDIRTGRIGGGGAIPWFPRSSAEYDDLADLVTAADPVDFCVNAICVPPDMDALQGIENIPSAANKSARYGQYTRLAPTPAATPLDTNPILTITTAGLGARYWIEAFRYDNTPSSAGHPSAVIKPDSTKNITYRITALAIGQKQTTRVVLKTIFVPYPASQNK